MKNLFEAVTFGVVLLDELGNAVAWTDPARAAKGPLGAAFVPDISDAVTTARREDAEALLATITEEARKNPLPDYKGRALRPALFTFTRTVTVAE